MNTDSVEIVVDNIISTRYFRNCKKCSKQSFEINKIHQSDDKDKIVYLRCVNCRETITVKYKTLEKYLKKMIREDLQYKNNGYYDSDNIKNTDALNRRASGSFESSKRK